jgi:hypothetical protein
VPAGDAPGSGSGSTAGELGRRLDAESRRGGAVCWFGRGQRAPLVRARQDRGEEGILYTSGSARATRT